ncbi:LysR substrate-binding domain-containing protein [Chromobacterium haemolyticum]|nr:LysR substrate-binding domain-containing protein [Chromobacterium haemolyticum]
MPALSLRQQRPDLPLAIRRRRAAIRSLGARPANRQRHRGGAACRAGRGLGLVYLPQAMAAPHLADGSLVSVLEAWMPPAEAFYLYYPHHLHQPAKLRVFIDYLRQAMASPTTDAH